mgnify:CR=1 FL=1
MARPTYTPQLATLVSVPPDGDEWLHEIKFDGYRMQLRVQDGEATLLTRKGLDWTVPADGYPLLYMAGWK